MERSPGESLLSVFRERLGIVSVKDGCAPQGQCGCCTVLVDGEPRVACVTPVTRVAGRAVTTVEGLDAPRRDALVDAFVGDRRVAVRLLHARDRRARRGARGRGGRHRRRRRRPCARRAPVPLHRLADDLRSLRRRCRRDACTAPARRGDGAAAAQRARARRWSAAAGRAPMCRSAGRVRRRHRAARRAGRGAAAPGSTAPSIEAAGVPWVVAESLDEARELAGKVQGRRTTVDVACRRSRCRRRPPAASASPPGGWSPPTSSPTRRGARPVASRPRRSRTAARSAARRPHRGRRRRTRAGRPHRPRRARRCSRAKTSCGSARSGRRSRRAAVRRATRGDARRRRG